MKKQVEKKNNYLKIVFSVNTFIIKRKKEKNFIINKKKKNYDIKKLTIKLYIFDINNKKFIIQLKYLIL